MAQFVLEPVKFFVLLKKSPLNYRDFGSRRVWIVGAIVSFSYLHGSTCPTRYKCARVTGMQATMVY